MAHANRLVVITDMKIMDKAGTLRDTQLRIMVWKLEVEI
jgi:hypothetical protein